MSKRIIILLIVGLLILVIIGIGVYYAFQIKGRVDQPAGEENIVDKEKYPDVVKGTIIFSDKKVTIKTESGTELSLWPPQLKSYYEEKGFQDGQNVEIEGKILERDRLFVKTIK